jgi:hypothetical protein
MRRMFAKLSKTILIVVSLTVILAALFPVGAFAQEGGVEADPLEIADQESLAVDASQLSADGNWIRFRGRTILPVGDSVTQGWMVLGKNFDQEAYLNALDRRGINAVLIWAYMGISDQKADERIGYDAPELWPWVKENGKFQLDRFNDEYFNRLRSFVQSANTKDIMVVITVHDGWTKDNFSGHPFNKANGGPLDSNGQYVELADYAREMPASYNESWGRKEKHQYYLERFSDRLIQATGDLPNVMYEIMNEGEWYNQTANRKFQVHFLDFFKARTAAPLLVNDDHVGGADFFGERSADVITLHKPLWKRSDSARTFFDHHASQSNAKPVFFTEPIPDYRGDRADLTAIMRMMWGTILGGSGFVMQNDASFGFDPNTRMAGKAGARDALLDLEGHAARFINDANRDLSAMEPKGSLCSTGVCLVNPGKNYLVYAQNGSSFTVNLRGYNDTFEVSWYNPETGELKRDQDIPGGKEVSFSPPSNSDWVLELRRAAGATKPDPKQPQPTQQPPQPTQGPPKPQQPAPTPSGPGQQTPPVDRDPTFLPLINNNG